MAGSVRYLLIRAKSASPYPAGLTMAMPARIIGTPVAVCQRSRILLSPNMFHHDDKRARRPPCPPSQRLVTACSPQLLKPLRFVVSAWLKPCPSQICVPKPGCQLRPGATGEVCSESPIRYMPVRTSPDRDVKDHSRSAVCNWQTTVNTSLSRFHQLGYQLSPFRLKLSSFAQTAARTFQLSVSITSSRWLSRSSCSDNNFRSAS